MFQAPFGRAVLVTGNHDDPLRAQFFEHARLPRCPQMGIEHDPVWAPPRNPRYSEFGVVAQNRANTHEDRVMCCAPLVRQSKSFGIADHLTRAGSGAEKDDSWILARRSQECIHDHRSDMPLEIEVCFP